MSEQNVTPGRSPFKKPPKPSSILGIIALVIVGMFLLTSFYIVDETEQAVVLRLGRLQKITEPGLNWKIPLGIDRVYKVPTKVVQTMQFGFRTAQPGITTIYSRDDYEDESLMLTGDLNIVTVTWIIQYRITDPALWLFKVQEKDKTIRDISQSVMNELVGDRAILDVIGDERTSIEIKSQEMMNTILDEYDLGINIVTVKLQNTLPPEGPVQDAFEDVNKAIQDMERLISEGKQAYNAEIPKASGQADQIIQQAKGYASGRVNRANGNVARFNSVLEEYRKNPSVTRNRIYYEMMEEVLTSGSKVELIDKNLDNFLPLKNLQPTQTGGTNE
ncbi:FtsH protease activity modulator HflK [Spirochaeta isovalerica]|uniref:Protein HflK n=1 Tax=Spirochaeta isovalerica TaxID=150 RepID=A0A841RH66_9SPIO|nr:FtsH protease activity modulator HflK [Spirochaeta isovalerica]MBB6481652.1 membrane protease subunit HflK [Spirochaeta isovalerica]